MTESVRGPVNAVGPHPATNEEFTKTLARVLRLRRALALARAGTPFATVAVRAGYADQAHLARDVKALTGVPLGVLTAKGGDAPVDAELGLLAAV